MSHSLFLSLFHFFLHSQLLGYCGSTIEYCGYATCPPAITVTLYQCAPTYVASPPAPVFVSGSPVSLPVYNISIPVFTPAPAPVSVAGVPAPAPVSVLAPAPTPVSVAVSITPVPVYNVTLPVYNLTLPVSNVTVPVKNVTVLGKCSNRRAKYFLG